jgi:hypothetical protein
MSNRLFPISRDELQAILAWNKDQVEHWQELGLYAKVAESALRVETLKGILDSTARSKGELVVDVEE